MIGETQPPCNLHYHYEFMTASFACLIFRVVPSLFCIYKVVNGDPDSERRKNKRINGESGTIFGFSAIQFWLVSCSFFNSSRQSSRPRWFLNGLFSALLGHSKERFVPFVLGTSNPMKKFLEVLLLHLSLSFQRKKWSTYNSRISANLSDICPLEDLTQGLIQ